MYTDLDDTIVAISSAPGPAPRGIVRLSGPDALTIAASLVHLSDDTQLTDALGFTVHHGSLQVFEDATAPADVYVFRAPHSYTQQDLIELHTISSPPLLEMIVERCLEHGARLAHPGEFTARAFLGGAMSLPEAESVAATIQARSDDQLRAARRMARDHFTATLRAWQSDLADLRALVEADIDFAEEPIDFIDPAHLRERVNGLRDQLHTLIASSADAAQVDTLPRVLLFGPPNVGKSSLMNRLTGIDRAIASAVAGTTRDLLSAPTHFDGIEAIVLDSAGVDESEDIVITAGRTRAIEARETAQVVCQVIDAKTAIQNRAAPVRKRTEGQKAEVQSESTKADRTHLIVINKIDLQSPEERHQLGSEFNAPDGNATNPSSLTCLVSALTGEGIRELQSAIADQLTADTSAGDDTTLALSAHQRQALSTAVQSLARCEEITITTDDLLDVAEFLALELREAQDALAELTGAVTTEDLLGRIFSSFCIGK
jgi:tRNA modification GTPase